MNLKKLFFRKTKTAVAPPPVPNVESSQQLPPAPPLPDRQSGLISFETMLSQSLEPRYPGHYLYHGSNISLEPGKDLLIPHKSWGAANRSVVFAAPLWDALRFALVRTYGTDQMQGTDFYAFVTQKYKLIIHADSWFPYDHHSNGPAYLYEVDARLFKENVSDEPVPILSKAPVSTGVLKAAGFDILKDNHADNVKRFYGLENTDSVIEEKVLPFLGSWQWHILDQMLKQEEGAQK